MSSRYEVTRLDELDRIPVGERGLEWRPIRRRFGLEAFGMNAYSSSRPGGEIVEEHTEEQLGHQEVYVVVRGHATFHLDDEDVDAPAGTLVVLRDPSVKRAATAVDADTLVLAVGGKPGEAFTPSAWESYFSAAPLMKEGRYDEAIALMQADAEEHGEKPAFLYNLACFEALGGRREEAVTHIVQAIEAAPRAAKWAKEDPDLESIRDDPRVSEALARHAT
ncbi:MAG: tetratricopeptide repeat protein [Actinobacteria bacterium]|nr:MAG: tetratricopeptide repeat protein [Actinomycetota bacterium]